MAESGTVKAPENREHTEPEASQKNVGSTFMAETEIDFSQPWSGSDIVFNIEDKEIHANKLILCMWSPVLEAMFTSDFREKDAKEITLPGKKHKDVLELMKVVHPPNKAISQTNVDDILPLVEEYQMRQITRRCELFLLSQPPTVKSLVIADIYGMPNLRAICIQYAKDTPISELKRQAEFEMIHPPTLNEVLLDKVEKFEPQAEQCRSILQDIRKKLDEEQPSITPCSGTIGTHLIGDIKACFECKAYNLDKQNKPSKETPWLRPPCKGTTLAHTLGQTNACTTCKEHNLDKIRRIVQRPVPIVTGAGGFSFGTVGPSLYGAR